MAESDFMTMSQQDLDAMHADDIARYEAMRDALGDAEEANLHHWM